MEAAVAFDPRVNQWMVVGYDEVRALLADERLTADRMHAFADRAPREAVAVVQGRAPWLISPQGGDYDWIGPLVHAGLRRTSSSAFKAEVAAAVDERLDELAGRDRFDAVADYAVPLTGRLVADLLGFERSAARQLFAWGLDIVVFFKAEEVTVDGAARMVASMGQLVEHARGRAEASSGGFLGSAAEAAGRRGLRFDDEALANIVLPLVTGHVDAAHLVATTIWTVLGHAEERERLVNAPHMLGGAVAEALRFAPPVATVPRTALERVVVDGAVIEPDAQVQLSLATAQRDPERFPDPDRFDIGRSQRGALGFGHGPRSCAAAALARTYAAVALDTLLRRRPAIALDQDVRWRPIPGVHALEHLGVVAHDDHTYDVKRVATRGSVDPGSDGS